MSKIDVSKVLKEFDYVNGQNANYRDYCQDISDFVLPRKSWITTLRTKGERLKFNYLYDSTAIRAIRILGAGFHSNLTNPTTRWFKLETRNKKFMQDHAVKMWFRNAEDLMFSVLNESNFYNIIQEFYIDYGAFGTGSFLMVDDVKDKVRFISVPISETNRVLDAAGRLCGFYRCFKFTAQQAFKLWGPRAGDGVVKAMNKEPFKEFEFIHYVTERHVREAGKKDSTNLPYLSAWINKKEKHIIQESGFFEMPYMSEVFYKDPTDENGFSPAMDVLPDIKMVNAMKKTIIRAAMKQADPPYLMPRRGFILPLNFNPAGINYVEKKDDIDALKPLDVGRGSFGVSVDMLKSVQEDIEEGLFVPLFRALGDVTKQMTIPEVQRRISENMVLLGPVIGRVMNGILDPTIIRLFNMLMRTGDIPAPPEQIQGKDFAPVYLSPLVQAQRSGEVAEIEAFLADVNAVAQVLPSALDKIDEDKIVDVLADMRGVPPELLKDEETLKRMREHRAEQEAMMMQMQQAGATAQIAKDGAQAEATLRG